MRQKRQIEEHKVNAVLGKLHEGLDFELPEEFLKAETQGQADSMVEEGLQGGMTEEQIAERQEELFATAGARARNNLKTNFILQEIAATEEIQVDDNALLQRVTQMAAQAKTPVKKYLKELQKTDRLGGIRQNMILAKAIDFLVDNATVTEIEPKDAESTDE